MVLQSQPGHSLIPFRPHFVDLISDVNHHSSQSPDYNSDPVEKFLPSVLEDVEKSPHNVPFSPCAQTAKNVGFTITCVGCRKPRLLHLKTVVKAVYQKGTKRMVGKLDYVCGSVLADYKGTGNDKDMKLLTNIYVRENISCVSNYSSVLLRR